MIGSPRRVAVAVAVTAALSACGDDDASDPGGHALLDAADTADLSDATRDPPVEASDDAGEDASTDGAAPDATPDVVDAAPDAGPFADHPLLDGTPRVIAHRGGAREFPEHTMTAYRGAIEVGADVLEVDVHLTSDGRMVCMHDDTVDRTTDGEGRVKDLTFDQVRALDAAWNFDGDGGHPLRGTGVRVPTFEEVLDAFPDALYVLEPKAPEMELTDAMLDAVFERGMEGQVVFGAFAEAPVLRARERGVLTGMTPGEQGAFIIWAPQVQRDYAAPVPIAQMPHNSVDEALASRAERYGVTVEAWTVNDREEMERLVDLGVTSIITDRPSLYVEVLAERGLR